MTSRPPAPSASHPRPKPLQGFEAIRRSRVHEEVAKQLRELISAGQLKPGDRLPPERELVHRFDVSRGSVRDAIRALEVLGLVRSRQGGGTFVQEASADSLLAPLSAALTASGRLIAEILDVRRIVEPAFAARAAVQAGDEEIAHLEAILRRQKEKAARRESTVEEDSEFHYVVAMASRNEVANRVVDVLMSVMSEVRVRSLQADGWLERSLEGHRRIVRALQRRSAPAAARAMRRHLDEVGALLRVETRPRSRRS